ncbi:MAG: hypothetical protein KJT03_00795 [Verrucomicrobiae bacterium]|nr:hypothetical protein [Verrucomicrobiae bacterium]
MRRENATSNICTA